MQCPNLVLQQASRHANDSVSRESFQTHFACILSPVAVWTVNNLNAKPVVCQGHQYGLFCYQAHHQWTSRNEQNSPQFFRMRVVWVVLWSFCQPIACASASLVDPSVFLERSMCTCERLLSFDQPLLLALVVHSLGCLGFRERVVSSTSVIFRVSVDGRVLHCARLRNSLPVWLLASILCFNQRTMRGCLVGITSASFLWLSGFEPYHGKVHPGPMIYRTGHAGLAGHLRLVRNDTNRPRQTSCFLVVQKWKHVFPGIDTAQ